MSEPSWINGMQLPDINVWLALRDPNHAHYAKAMAWKVGLSSGETLHYCRITQMGFLRLSTNPSVTLGHPLTMSDAWLHYDIFIAEPNVSYVEEPKGLEPIWRSLTTRQTFSHKLWNDAYLAAFAICAGIELVTFDQGFKQFPGLKCTILQ